VANSTFTVTATDANSCTGSFAYTLNVPIPTYTWSGGTSGLWATAGNWTPPRALTTTSDILQFNGGVAVTVTGVATQTIGKLLLSNGSTFLPQSGTAAVLTIAGGAGTDFDVPAGCAMNLTGTSALTIALASGATGTVGGSITFAAANVAHRLNAVGTSALVFQNGSQFTMSSLGGGFPFGDGTGTSGLNSVEFQSGSTYIHLVGSNPFGAAQPNAVAVFDPGSLFSYRANLAPSLGGRTYANFEVAGGAAASITSGVNVAWTFDRFEIKSGSSMSFAATGGTPNALLHIKGDLVVDGTLSFGASDQYALAFDGTAPQTISGAGVITLPSNLAGVTVNNASGVTLARNLTVGCPFTFTAGKVTTGANTLTLGGTVAGAGAVNYVNGNLARVIGTGAQSPAFAIGDATDYTPLSLSYASVTTGGTVTAHVTAATHPQLSGSIISTSKYVKRYWTLANAGVAGAYDATFNFLPGDVQAEADPNSFAVGDYSSSVWTYPTVVSRTATSTVATGLTTYSDFVVGEPTSAPPAPTTTTLASSPNPSMPGTSVTLTATVSPGAASGTVTFYAGTTSLGTGELSGGMATLDVSGLPVGLNSLHAAYSGDATYAGSVSTDLVQTVQPSSAMTYVWNGAGPDWTVPANWTPARTLPWPTDVLVFPVGGTVLNIPVQTIGHLVLSNNASLTLKAGTANNTLTIAGTTGTGLDIPEGCSLITATPLMLLVTNPGVASSVAGTLSVGAPFTNNGNMVVSGTLNDWFGFTNAGSMQVGGTLAIAYRFTDSGSLQVGGTVIIHPNGYIENNNPVYGTGSLLKYATNNTYKRYNEWGGEAACPYNVQITNSTTLELSNADGQKTRRCNGSLTIDPGSTLTMKGSTSPMYVPFTVQGDVSLGGTLELSSLSGGDLILGGNWARAGTLTPNGRMVRFQGSAAQAITGATTFDQLRVQNPAGVTLNNDITVNIGLDFQAGVITTGASKVIVGPAGNITNGYVVGTIQLAVGTGSNVSRQMSLGDNSGSAGILLGFGTVSTAGTITGTTTGGAHPNLGSAAISPTKNVGRYWTLTNSGVAFTDCTMSIGFPSGDVQNGADFSKFVVGKYDAGIWTYPAVSSRGAGGIGISGLTSLSDFAVGEPGHLVTTTTLTSSPNPSATGTSVTLTATVSPSAATGTVMFYDGAALLGPGALGSGTATLSLSSLAAGSHSLTASYGGDASYDGSVSSPVTHDVVLPPATYVWNGATSNWTLSTNWTPPRTPQPNDILQFNGSATVTGIPIETIGELDLANNATVSLQAAVTGNTLTLGYGSATALNVPAGCTLTTPVGSLQPPLIVRPGASANIAGAMSWGGVITNDGAFNVSGTGTLTMFVPFVNNGSCTVAGTFLLWSANADATGNVLTYGPNGTLAFRSDPDAAYDVNGNAYWPATDGPVNVTVLSNGDGSLSGIDMKVPRTVNGLFQTAAGVKLTGVNLFLNGTVQIDKTAAVPGVFGSAPTYGPSSTLKYNTLNFTYRRGTEWSADSVFAPGCPANVQISNNTILDLGYNGTGVARKCSGNLTIDSGSKLSMNEPTYAMTAPLTVLGNLNLAGALELSSVAGGDFQLAGNWTRTTGTFIPNGRSVTIMGSNQVTITATGGETFYSLIEDKPIWGILLASDLTINGTIGDVLTIKNAGDIDLRGHTLTFAGDGGNLRGDGYTRWIYSTTGPATIVFNGAKTLVSTSTAPAMAAAVARPEALLQTQMVEEVVRQGRGFVLREVAVPTELAAPMDVQGIGGLDFGETLTFQVNAPLTFPTSAVMTVRGTLQLNEGGSVINPPAYAGAATLVYNMPSGFTVGGEWSSTSSGVSPGVPKNVTVQAGTGTLVMPMGARNVPGAFQLQSGTVQMNGPLYARGTATLASFTKVDLNNQTFGFLGTTFTNDGQILVPHTTQPLSTLSFGNSTAPIVYTGSGTVGTAMDPLAYLSLRSKGQTVTLDAPAGIYAIGCALFRGTLVHSERLTLGGGTDAPPWLQFGNGGPDSSTGGSFDVTPTYNLGSSQLGIYYGYEGVPRVTGVEIPTPRELSYVTCLNSNGVSIAGGPLSAQWTEIYNSPLSLGVGNKLTVGAGGGIWAYAPGNLATGANGGQVEFSGVGSATGVTFYDVALDAGAVDFGTPAP
jgi:hypothetical protein